MGGGGSCGLVLHWASTAATAGAREGLPASTLRDMTSQGPPAGSRSMPPASRTMTAPTGHTGQDTLREVSIEGSHLNMILQQVNLGLVCTGPTWVPCQHMACAMSAACPIAHRVWRPLSLTCCTVPAAAKANLVEGIQAAACHTTQVHGAGPAAAHTAACVAFVAHSQSNISIYRRSVDLAAACCSGYAGGKAQHHVRSPLDVGE